MSTRRQFLGHGCAALLLATMPATAEAALRPEWAPRLSCPHAGCRHHRPVNGGTCGFALRGGRVLLPDEPLPTQPSHPPVAPLLADAAEVP